MFDVYGRTHEKNLMDGMFFTGSTDQNIQILDLERKDIPPVQIV